MKLLSKEIKEGKKDLKAFKRLNERELGDITNEKLTEAEKALKEKIDARLEISRNFRGYELFLKKIRWDKEYRKKVAKDASVAVALAGIGYMSAGTGYSLILNIRLVSFLDASNQVTISKVFLRSQFLSIVLS